MDSAEFAEWKILYMIEQEEREGKGPKRVSQDVGEIAAFFRDNR